MVRLNATWLGSREQGEKPLTPKITDNNNSKLKSILF